MRTACQEASAHASRAIPYTPRVRDTLGRALGAWLVLGAFACGGGDEGTRETTSGGSQATMPDPASLNEHVVIPLEAGELRLGSVIPGADEVQLVLAAPRGELVLFACDQLEGETSRNRFVLGSVAYEREGREERIGGTVRRADLMRLATESGARFFTCDEEILLGDDEKEAMRLFLTGQEPEAPEQLESRSIALEGLTLSFQISDRAPDQVRIRMTMAQPVAMDECDLVVIVREEMFPLGLMSLEPGGPNPHRSDYLEAVLPRANVQNLVMEEEASLIICGDVWVLDAVTLQNIRSLVGSPVGGVD